MQKKHREWIEKKIETEKKSVLALFQPRDIFWTRVGENIGFEQGGKDENFIRPVLVVKKFNNHVFWGIPLTTAKKSGKYYIGFEFIHGKKSTAILSQLKLFDVKRLEKKIGVISKKDFTRIKKALLEIMESF